MTKTSDELLNLDISYCNNKFSKETPSIKLSQAFDEIKSTKNKRIIESLRADLQHKDNYKNQLDGYIFTGTFSTRGTTNLIKYSNLCVLDFDHLTRENIDNLKEFLKKDKFVFAYWDSPSGTGVKGLICFDFSMIINLEIDIPTYHKQAFCQFSDYFDKAFNNSEVTLDSSGKDIPRLCFSSYDPNIIIKDKTECFLVEIAELEKTEINKTKKKVQNIGKRKKLTSKDLNEDIVKQIKRDKNEVARRKIKSVYKYLDKRNLSITETYERWYKVGQIIANTFSYNIGKEYFLKLCRLDIKKNKHDEERSKTLIIKCYLNSLSPVQNPLHFNSLLFYAQEKGWNNGKRGNKVEKIPSGMSIKP